MIRRPINIAAVISFVFVTALPAMADNFVVYGASGKIGDIIVTEALDRGHHVTGVSRNPENLTNAHPNFSAIAGDVTNLESMIAVISGADAVILSLSGGGPGNTPEEATTARAAATFVQAAKQLGDSAPHAVQVGGGTTLWVNGVWALEELELEEGTPRHGQYYGHWMALETYKASSGVKWTVMTPPPSAMQPRARTGEYRLGEEEVLFNADGESFISTEDFVVALVDEAESGQSVGKRVAVGPPY